MRVEDTDQNRRVEGAIEKQRESLEWLGLCWDEGFDKDSEIKKLNKELEYNIGFLKSVDSKLKNKNFISNAPKEIIDKEKQKIIDTEQKIKSIKKSISELS